jgi:LCP family protein required for cell wall assembly
MTQIQENTPKYKKTPLWVKLLLLVAFIALAGVTAVLVFNAVRSFVTSWEITDLPGIVVKPEQGATPVPGQTSEDSVVNPGPNQPSLRPTPEPWDGASRVNMLVMGLDYRDWESGEGAPRTDTMILVSVDPLSQTAGMLSIPRDLWVSIPGFEHERINTAYRSGEIYEMPGGGPGLAMATVEELLGLEIDYYAQIDFFAFERFIDEIGGVKIDIPETIKVDPVGEKLPRNLPPGTQVLPGDLALAYARARNSEGVDFDRAVRQQQVIMAIRNRLLHHDMLFSMIGKASSLYEELSSGINTNMSLDQAIKLAWLLPQIPEENIKSGVIGPPDYVAFGKSPDGMEVVKPRPQNLRLLRDEIFTTTGITNPELANATAKDMMLAESAAVSVLNGAATPGLATRTQDYLDIEGITVIGTGDSPDQQTSTLVIDYTGNPYTLKYLVDLMGISENKILHRFDPASEVDVVVILGYDWANNNPMP